MYLWCHCCLAWCTHEYIRRCQLCCSTWLADAIATKQTTDLVLKLDSILALGLGPSPWMMLAAEGMKQALMIALTVGLVSTTRGGFRVVSVPDLFRAAIASSIPKSWIYHWQLLSFGGCRSMQSYRWATIGVQTLVSFIPYASQPPFLKIIVIELE